MKGCEKSRRVRGEEGDRLVKAAAISDNFYAMLRFTSGKKGSKTNTFLYLLFSSF